MLQNMAAFMNKIFCNLSKTGDDLTFKAKL